LHQICESREPSALSLVCNQDPSTKAEWMEHIAIGLQPRPFNQDRVDGSKKMGCGACFTCSLRMCKGPGQTATLSLNQDQQACFRWHRAKPVGALSAAVGPKNVLLMFSLLQWDSGRICSLPVQRNVVQLVPSLSPGSCSACFRRVPVCSFLFLQISRPAPVQAAR
jgi:hypothetical protein